MAAATAARTTRLPLASLAALLAHGDPGRIPTTRPGDRGAVGDGRNPDWNAPAKKLGGKWDSAGWMFDARDEAKVRALALRIYGTDGAPVAAEDMLTLRLSASLLDGRDGSFGGSRPTSWWFAGRQVARAFGRDSGATLGEGVIVIKGGFASGGSMKNPSCTFSAGTIVEVRDVPRALAQKLFDEYHGITLFDASGAVIAEATLEAVEPVMIAPEAGSTLARMEFDARPHPQFATWGNGWTRRWEAGEYEAALDASMDRFDREHEADRLSIEADETEAAQAYALALRRLEVLS